MSEEHSLLGLDQEHTFLQKLGLFLSMLVVGPLLGVILALGVSMQQGVWQSVGIHGLQTLGVFWLALLVFVWWRPPWFRRVYLTIEYKVVLLARICVALLLAAFVGLVVMKQLGMLD